MRARAITCAASTGLGLVTLAALVASGCGGAAPRESRSDQGVRSTTAGGEAESATPSADMAAEPPGAPTSAPPAAEPAPSGGDGAEAIGPGGPDADPTLVVDSQQRELEQAVTDLQGALEMATVDCGRARDLRDTICDLSDRICRIAERHPEHGTVQSRCEDGRDRCEDAREDVGDECD